MEREILLSRTQELAIGFCFEVDKWRSRLLHYYRLVFKQPHTTDACGSISRAVWVCGYNFDQQIARYEFPLLDFVNEVVGIFG
jgi:hypothetical protein